MGLTLRIHVVAAGLGLIFGWVALAASKGETVHRKSGILFVYAMVTMSLAGAAMAAFKGEAGNVIAGLLTAYLVTTALLTVRPATAGVRRTEVGAMLMALALALTIVTLAFQALASPTGTRFGIPFGMYFMFGTVAVLACIGDVRMIRSGGLRGRPRLARHLWRMCYALFIATASFFLGPRARVARVLPEQLLHPGLLALPVLAVLVLMCYWLWRVRSRRPFRGLVGLRTAEAS